MGVNTLTENEKQEQLNEVVAAHKADGRKAMMSVLQKAQAIYGFLPLEVLKTRAMYVLVPLVMLKVPAR